MSFNLLDEEKVIKFGDFNVHFDGSSLRYLSHGKTELIRRIYFAVRDTVWGTVPCVTKNFDIKTRPDGFNICFDAICKDGVIDFRWKCKISGTTDCLSFEILGKAFTAFDSNRIGFCLLHPLYNYRGREIEVKHSDGYASIQKFPEYIAPHQPIKDITALQINIDSVDFLVRFDGDIFEMEDQRNWLDASFKTYCTPLALPLPKKLEVGQEVKQLITIDLLQNKPTIKKAENFKVQFLKGEIYLPTIGLDFPDLALSNWTIEKIKDLNLSHLRTEIRIDEEDWSNNFQRKLSQVKTIGAGIELVIISKKGSKRLKSQIRLFEWQSMPLVSVSFLSTDSTVPDDDTLNCIIPILKEVFKNVPIGTGTDAYFTELNRDWPVFKNLNFCSFSVNPQVHAHDDISILETPMVSADIINTIKNRENELNIHFSPVTLSPRLNYNKVQDGLVQNKLMDRRQGTSFNTLWCWSMVKFLSENSCGLVTLNAIDGPHGILNQESELTYPVFEFFQVLGRHRMSKIIPSISNDPLTFESMIFDNGYKREAILLNLSKKNITIDVLGKSVALNARSSKIVVLD